MEEWRLGAALPLRPGPYEYKFVVDGVWLPDPRNAKIKEGDQNAVLVVTAK